MIRIRTHLLLCFITLLTLTMTSSAARNMCDVCDDAINGSYTEYTLHGIKITVCANCDRNKPHCQNCEIPNNKESLYFVRGEHLCKICIQHAKYCSVCEKRITKEYTKYGKGENQETVCNSCNSTQPKCPACGVPHLKNQLDRKTGLCSECNTTLNKCSSCGKQVYGKYFKDPSSKSIFCNECYDNKPRCYTCGLPVGKWHRTFPDGREICEACNKQAIYSGPMIQVIARETRLVTNRLLGMQVKHPIKLTLEKLNTDSAGSAEIAKYGQSTASPLYGKELGLHRYSNGKSEIVMLFGLPEAIVYEVAAHEYAHAWQAENCPRNQSKELREGFAQWVAAIVLRAKGHHKALERLEARKDNPYGTGYHKVKQMAMKYGRPNVIEYAKKATGFDQLQYLQ